MYAAKQKFAVWPVIPCLACHPQVSNCGLNLESMDTISKSSKSLRNMHLVKCIDCQTNDVPQ